MRKILLSILLSFILISSAQAGFIEMYQLGQSSFTNTNETTARISSFTLKGGMFLGVVIDSASPLGTLTLADAYVSTSVAGIVYSTFAILSLSGGNAPNNMPTYIPFNIRLSSGLAYTTTNNAGGVTIIYKSLNPVH